MRQPNYHGQLLRLLQPLHTSVARCQRTDRTQLQQKPLSANAVALEGFKLTLMACWKGLECCFLRVTLSPTLTCV